MTQSSSLPSTPPAPAGEPPALYAARSPRPGELTHAWTWALALAWIGVFVGFAAVWKASRELGLPTWWLGPVSDQQPLYITMVPFLAPSAVVLLAFTRNSRVSWVAIGAGVVSAAVAAGDLAPFSRFGVVELAIAAAGTGVAIASLAGRYRRATPETG